jgi:hypothetical protein
MQTAPTESTKTLPPALFDELKKRADAAGGIGYGASRTPEPRCIGDFARAIDGDNGTLASYDAWSTVGKEHQVLVDLLGQNVRRSERQRSGRDQSPQRR